MIPSNLPNTSFCSIGPKSAEKLTQRCCCFCKVAQRPPAAADKIQTGKGQDTQAGTLFLCIRNNLQGLGSGG